MFKLYENLVRPALFTLRAETAHEMGLEALRIGLGSKAAQSIAARRFVAEPFGKLERFGLEFRNPLGIAAGFDKNGKVVNQLSSLGFGFVEVGTITYEPQRGNDKPRLFRLPKDQALINRMGFNNDGAAAIVNRLKDIEPTCILGINIGKNKETPMDAATENYLKSFELAHPVADYVAVNISSPNTPNLRDLQRAENLNELLRSLQNRNDALGTKPLLVKIAPDLNEGEIESIVDTCIARRIAGIIATNTTSGREGLKTSDVTRFGAGGLSGRPLARMANNVIALFYKYSKGRLPIIGVGGIFTARDAFDKVTAGAGLLQAYTGFVYGGMTFAREINLGLASILEERGCRTLDEAIGTSVRL
jgi:dihydroorotate dehydrogenase